MKKILLSAALLLPAIAKGELILQPTPLNTAVKPPMTVSINGVTQLNGIDALVKDQTALVQLGKAFFWDTAIGSDGMACASCHFSAGADSRIDNQINSGYNHNNSRIYDTLPGGTKGANATLKKSDFPLWKFTGVDPADPRRMLATVVDDVISSSGTQNGNFINITATPNDNCTSRVRDEANILGLNTRRVAPRNSPSTINATFNVRNFWDGRANRVFNGVNPFGLRDPDAKIWINEGTPVPATLVINNASLASQAVGPVLSDLEMQCNGRSFSTVGTKLVNRRILETQIINATDSVLAPIKNKPLYRDMIRRAFQPIVWSGSNDSNIPLDEANFTLFFGLAVQAYEDTLVSDQTKYDLLPRTEQPVMADGFTEPVALAPQLIRAPNGVFQGMTASESRGLDLFMGTESKLNPTKKDGKCIACHKGPEFTSATYTALAGIPKGITILLPDAVQKGQQVEPMPFTGGFAEINGTLVFDHTQNFGSYDLGFYDIGVTPLAYDIGLGGVDPWGNPLSFTQQWATANPLCESTNTVIKCSPTATVDVFNVYNDFVDVNGNKVNITAELAPAKVAGSFKTPGLRNLSLTAPYYHNGSAKTIQEAMIVYNNGGLFKNPNLHPDVVPLGFNTTDINDITNFMLTLTDPRVAREAAPFDHPSLMIPNGHTAVKRIGTSDAVDKFLSLPAVGRAGRTQPATFQSKLK